MSKEISRAPLLIKALAFILTIIGILIIYLTASSPELETAHKLVGYGIGFILTLIPGAILIFNITE